MAIDASRRLVMRQGRSVRLPIARLPSRLAARAREAGIDGNVADEIRDALTDAERQSQKGA